MAKKSSDHIRIRTEDKKEWGQYCKALGTPSPDLFHKVMTSPHIKLNEKILEELKKNEEELKKKIFFKNGKVF